MRVRVRKPHLIQPDFSLALARNFDFNPGRAVPDALESRYLHRYILVPRRRRFRRKGRMLHTLCVLRLLHLLHRCPHCLFAGRVAPQPGNPFRRRLGRVRVHARLRQRCARASGLNHAHAGGYACTQGTGQPAHQHALQRLHHKLHVRFHCGLRRAHAGGDLLFNALRPLAAVPVQVVVQRLIHHVPRQLLQGLRRKAFDHIRQDGPVAALLSQGKRRRQAIHAHFLRDGFYYARRQSLHQRLAVVPAQQQLLLRFARRRR